MNVVFKIPHQSLKLRLNFAHEHVTSRLFTREHQIEANCAFESRVQQLHLRKT
jgi:hypothetical protein